MENAVVSHIDLQRLVTKDDVVSPTLTAVTISCGQIDAGLMVLQAMAGSTSNPWVKLSLSVAVQALQVFKSAKGCP